MRRVQSVVGRTYAATVYAVGREKVREFALATGETEPLYLDPQAARRAGYADVVAPPMFAVVYAAPALEAAYRDPELEIAFDRLVHGAQDLRWGPVVVAGEEISTTGAVAEVSERAGLQFFVFTTVSVNGLGETVCEGTWTNIVRAP